MANKNNPNLPRRSKPQSRSRSKPAQVFKKSTRSSKIIQKNHLLSSKKQKKLLRNKAYNAQRIIEEAVRSGGDVAMKDETLSRKQEKLLRNQQMNNLTDAEKGDEVAQMDVSDDL